MKKTRYNLLFAISDMKLDRAFDEYKKTLNPIISENRKARAFLTKYARIIGTYKLPCYEIGKECSHDTYYQIHEEEIREIISISLFD